MVWSPGCAIPLSPPLSEGQSNGIRALEPRLSNLRQLADVSAPRTRDASPRPRPALIKEDGDGVMRWNDAQTMAADPGWDTRAERLQTPIPRVATERSRRMMTDPGTVPDRAVEIHISLVAF